PWQFCVADNGIGIAPEFAEKVFVIFQRLHGREAYPGTGIGLALCKRIIEHHGGDISVDTGYPDGTRICFTLPRIDAARPEEPGGDATTSADDADSAEGIPA
ncbi:MAG TPA: ATP-binding protein, partial [Streptosporangiaceae bacterium]